MKIGLSIILSSAVLLQCLLAGGKGGVGSEADQRQEEIKMMGEMSERTQRAIHWEEKKRQAAKAGLVLKEKEEADRGANYALEFSSQSKSLVPNFLISQSGMMNDKNIVNNLQANMMANFKTEQNSRPKPKSILPAFLINKRTQVEPKVSEPVKSMEQIKLQEAVKALSEDSKIMRTYQDSILYSDFRELLRISEELLKGEVLSTNLIEAIRMMMLAYQNNIKDLGLVADDINKVKTTFYVSSAVRHNLLRESLADLQKVLNSFDNSLNSGSDRSELSSIVDVILVTLEQQSIFETKGNKVYEKLPHKFRYNGRSKPKVQDSQYTRMVVSQLSVSVKERLGTIVATEDELLEKIWMTPLSRHIRLLYARLHDFVDASSLTRDILEGINDLLNSLALMVNSAEYEETSALGFVDIWITFDFYAYFGVKRDANYLLMLLKENEAVLGVKKHCSDIKIELSGMTVRKNRVVYVISHKKVKKPHTELIVQSKTLDNDFFSSSNSNSEVDLRNIHSSSRILKLTLSFLKSMSRFVALQKPNKIAEQLDAVKSKIRLFFNHAVYLHSSNPKKWGDVYRYLDNDFDQLITGVLAIASSIDAMQVREKKAKECKAAEAGTRALIQGLNSLRSTKRHVYESLPVKKQAKASERQTLGVQTRSRAAKPHQELIRTDTASEEAPTEELNKFDDQEGIAFKFELKDDTDLVEELTLADRLQDKPLLQFAQIELDEISNPKDDLNKYQDRSAVFQQATKFVVGMGDLLFDKSFHELKSSYKTFLQCLSDLFVNADKQQKQHAGQVTLTFMFGRAEFKQFTSIIRHILDDVKTLDNLTQSELIKGPVRELLKLQRVLGDLEKDNNMVETIDLDVNELQDKDVLDSSSVSLRDIISSRIKHMEVLSAIRSAISNLESSRSPFVNSEMGFHLIRVLSGVYSLAKDETEEKGLIEGASDIMEITQILLKNISYSPEGLDRGFNSIYSRDLELLVETLCKFKHAIISIADDEEAVDAALGDVDNLKEYMNSLRIEEDAFVEQVSNKSNQDFIKSLNGSMIMPEPNQLRTEVTGQRVRSANGEANLLIPIVELSKKEPSAGHKSGASNMFKINEFSQDGNNNSSYRLDNEDGEPLFDEINEQLDLEEEFSDVTTNRGLTSYSDNLNKNAPVGPNPNDVSVIEDHGEAAFDDNDDVETMFKHFNQKRKHDRAGSSHAHEDLNIGDEHKEASKAQELDEEEYGLHDSLNKPLNKSISHMPLEQDKINPEKVEDLKAKLNDLIESYSHPISYTGSIIRSDTQRLLAAFVRKLEQPEKYNEFFFSELFKKIELFVEAVEALPSDTIAIGADEEASLNNLVMVVTNLESFLEHHLDQEGGEELSLITSQLKKTIKTACQRQNSPSSQLPKDVLHNSLKTQLENQTTQNQSDISKEAKRKVIRILVVIEVVNCSQCVNSPFLHIARLHQNNQLLV